MLDYHDVYDATKQAIADTKPDARPSRQMMRINEFDAVNEEGRDVRVIGVIDDDDSMLNFIVIIEDADEAGEIYPIVEHTVFRKPEPIKLAA